MKLRKRGIVGIIFFVLLFVSLFGLLLVTYDKKTSLNYEKVPFSEETPVYTTSLEEMANRFEPLTKQEKGKGILTHEYTNWNKAKGLITVEQTYTGDDSIGPGKYYIFVEKKEKGWTVVEFGREVNCTRGRSVSGACL